ncbi:hypothetical protein [Paenibacillus thalictri]|uniref:Uncharacterized protein n=1 Tax=Paenibacillus thalictri TaxID=2527873 RepID=A0A4Q9DPZ3_9BACL|nr:hypothetical protein [Paenibacillus thalictri]TBL75335.1 hypothetical protein EYB31_23285 [Paenibacillus thalictri]
MEEQSRPPGEGLADSLKRLIAAAGALNDEAANMIQEVERLSAENIRLKAELGRLRARNKSGSMSTKLREALME